MSEMIIVAVDGYASSGKSTIARELAKKLGYKYIDTGAMYRAVTLQLMEYKIDPENTDAVNRILEKLQINFVKNPITLRQDLMLNDENVEDKIRSWAVTSLVSKVSTLPEVRHKLIVLQQEMGKKKGIVMDGRDIGTRVFPDAELKIFVTAEINVRARRRFNEVKQKHPTITLEEVKNNLQMRDHEDTTRKESPLIKAKDAKLLDNTSLTHDEQIQIVMDWVKETVKITSKKT